MKATGCSVRRGLGWGISALCVIILAAPAALATTEPCIAVTKTCEDAVAMGAPIPYEGTVTNCGLFPLYDVSVEDITQGELAGETIFVLEGLTLMPGDSAYYSGSYFPPSYPYTNLVIARGWLVAGSGGDPNVLDKASATCGILQREEICRTPGFWGLHSGEEKTDSQNITQAVIGAAGGSLQVCGQPVDNTMLESMSSALEAMCVSVRAESGLQLFRHLVAASLNCVMSNGDASCAGTSIESLFADCNAVCAADGDPGYCIEAVSCYNEGGILMDSGICRLGTCNGDDVTACEEDEDCGLDDMGNVIPCIPDTGTCSERVLVNDDLGLDFEEPGPAGSSKACNDAIKNDCTVFECE